MSDMMLYLEMTLVFILAGVLCGIMINIAMDRKPLESGALIAGAIVGILMKLL